MLNFLRAKQHNLFVKLFLGIIGFLLVAFFGVRNSDKFSHQGGQVASVNGVAITGLLVDYKLDQKLEQLRSLYNMSEFPPNLMTSLRANTLENVIQIELVRQNLAELGLDTPDAELSQNIKTTIVQDGVFNRDFYINDFLPSFTAQTGRSFEDEFRAQISSEKVFDEFDDLFSLSDEEALKIYNWQNTKFRYIVVKVPKFKKKETDANAAPEAAQAIDTEEADPTAAVTAAQLLDDWSKGGDIGKLLKPTGLSQTITTNLSPIQLERVFDGDAAFEDIAAIAKLTSAKPFSEKLFEKEKFFYLVKLDAKTAAPDKPDEKALEQIKANYANEMANTLESSWLDALTAKAKISRTPI